HRHEAEGALHPHRRWRGPGGRGRVVPLPQRVAAQRRPRRRGGRGDPRGDPFEGAGMTGKAESPEGFPRQTDGFDRLWTPHRMVYVAGDQKPTDGGAVDCPFCAAPGRTDEDGLIVARGEHVYAVLNLYPYNPGHLLVCPYRHVADYTDLTADETRELAEFTQEAMRAIRRVSSPPGFNLGMNQGAA